MQIGIVIISIFFSILVFRHKPNAYPYDEDFGLLLNIILMFLMTKGMTQNLFNITLNCRGITWLKVGMHHNGMLFG
jgi:hypothetical protein